ncbi:MAG TPA: hypothetical protein VL443_01440 [Cyclobacteriaceae bacterium]|jgi:hypothetical protein|nr:hypothetical protein [Cyclobacteriaceae bacterium]
MKRHQSLLTAIIVFIASAAQAQQWNGVTTSTGSIYRTGNIGVGPETVIPGFTSIFVSNSGGLNPSIMFKDGDALTNQKIWDLLAQGNRFRILTETDNYGSVQDAFVISRSGVNVTTSTFPNGNVGIGTQFTSNPNGYRLAVKGKIGAQEVQVENTSTTWADYVFEPTYKLRPLKEVKMFIKLNKHLPEIPSAEEIKENGHKLGEMDVLLLKKIEEMTLYMLEQEERIKSLEEQVLNLKKK